MTDKQTELQLDNVIWVVSVHTKHGTDIILIKQDDEPSNEDLGKIKKQFIRDYDLEEEDVYVDLDLGTRFIDKLPTSVDEYLAS